jgi:hypothetical protein
VKSDMMSHLGVGMDFETWDLIRRNKVEVLDRALRMMENCDDLVEAKRVITTIRDLYEIVLPPMGLDKSKVEDALSPAEIRRRANSAWGINGFE